MADDDGESDYGGLYLNGHWDWDPDKIELAFIYENIGELPEDTIPLTKSAPTHAVHFKNDIDVMEQMRFRNRYQRKVPHGHREVVTVQEIRQRLGTINNIYVQDLKDVALFTAPMKILSEMLINILHRPTTERFIRALILYCQYYTQTVEIMSKRKKIDSKIRTPQSQIIENEYRDNLCDLRLLVAKEYSTIIVGGADTSKFHHMGIWKRKSLTDRDAHLYETLIRMCIQIVWLALGRQYYNLIELEVNRLFKTEIFNSVEHNLRTGYYENMSREEKHVLIGHCLGVDKKLKMHSPMFNEIFCNRYIDYRLMSFGVIKNDYLSPRLLYLQQAVAAAEETLEENNVVIGILGMERSRFDSMLNPISLHLNHTPSRRKMHPSSVSLKSGVSNKSVKSIDDLPVPTKLFPDIRLPKREPNDENLPASFHDTLAEIHYCSAEQRDRWLTRLNRMLNCRKSTACF